MFLFALLQFLDNINRKSIFTVGLWFALRQKSSVCTKGADANAFTSPVLFSLGVGGRWGGGVAEKAAATACSRQQRSGFCVWENWKRKDAEMWSRDPCGEGQCAERVMNIWGDEGWEALGVYSWCVCVCEKE